MNTAVMTNPARAEAPAAASRSAAAGSIDLSMYLGSWRNCYPKTKGITVCGLAARDGRHYLQPRALCGPSDWGEIEVGVFSGSPDSREAVALHGACRFDSMDVAL